LEIYKVFHYRNYYNLNITNQITELLLDKLKASILSLKSIIYVNMIKLFNIGVNKYYL